jgi:DNA-binding IclR family transcriptional regulator
MSPRRAPSRLPPPVKPDDTAGSALAKGIAVLEAVLAADVPMQLADVAARLEQPKTSVHRLLMQLEEAGLLRRDLSGKAWMHAPRLIRMSLRSLARAARVDPVQTALRRLVDEVGESVNLGVLDGNEITYIERVECNWPLRTMFAPGSRVPVHCTAAGKLFLAELKHAERDRVLGPGKLAAYTGRTLIDRRALHAELDRVRETGVAVNDQEFMVGLIGLGVPVRASDGALVAVVALHAPVPRLTAEEAMRHLPALRRTAKEIATGLLA